MSSSSIVTLLHQSGTLRLLGIGVVLVGALMTVIPPAVTAVVNSDHPLDKYPGFGRSQLAMVRDDTIALWEAFRREKDISGCMAQADFDYWPAVAFPDQALADVANSLGVPLSDGTSSKQSPFERNRAYESALSARLRDAYNSVLYGENRKDMAEAMRTGRVPDGREDSFARGGCFGKAELTSSIWDLRRSMDDELVQMSRDVFSSMALASARAAFRGCAMQAGGIGVSDPSELDRFVADGGSRDGAEIVYSLCLEDWQVAHAQAERDAAAIFAKNHAEALAGWDQRYRSTLDVIRSDGEFLDYLADVPQVASEDGDGH